VEIVQTRYVITVGFFIMRPSALTVPPLANGGRRFCCITQSFEKVARIALAAGLSDPPLGQAREQVGIRSKASFPGRR